MTTEPVSSARTALGRDRAGPRRSLVIGQGVALLAVGVATVFGLPMPFLLSAVAVAWFVVVRPRAGAAGAAAVGVLISLTATLASLVLARLIGIPPLAVLVVGLTACAAAGLAAAAGSWVPSRSAAPPERARRAMAGLAILTGCLVWAVTCVLTGLIPGASRVAWATLNDAANYLLFARQIFIDGGIEFGPDKNPVPLGAALIAAVALPGRWQAAAADLAEHDVTALAGTWALGIAALCTLTGVLAFHAISARHSAMRLIGSALSSLVPLTWFISGLPIEYGYLNVTLGLCLLVLAMICYAVAESAPGWSLAGLLMAAVLVMATWSPLTPIVALLAVIVVARRWKRLRRSSRAEIAAVGMTAVLAVAFALAVAVPSFAASSEAIGGAIPIYPIRLPVAAGAALAALIFAAVPLVTRRAGAPLLGVVAVCAGGGFAVAFFLLLRRNEDFLWGYYPYKALWFITALLVLLAFVHGFAAIAEVLGALAWQILATVLLVVGGAWFLRAANTVVDYGAMSPVQRLLTGTVLVDDAADDALRTVFALSDPARQGILWRSDDPNRWTIDFWTVKLASPGFDDPDLHAISYVLDGQDVVLLCELADLLGPPITVYSAQPDQLQRDLDAQCPEQGNVVVPEPVR